MINLLQVNVLDTVCEGLLFCSTCMLRQCPGTQDNRAYLPLNSGVRILC